MGMIRGGYGISGSRGGDISCTMNEGVAKRGQGVASFVIISQRAKRFCVTP